MQLIDQKMMFYTLWGAIHLLFIATGIITNNERETSYFITGRIIYSSEARPVNNHYIMIVDIKRTNK